MSRFRNAITCQQGACNPSAIINSMRFAIDEIHREAGPQLVADTDTILKDPAFRLMVHQLAFLCKVSDLNDIREYDRAMAACMGK